MRCVPHVATVPRRSLAVLVAVLLGLLLAACGDSTPRGTATYSGGAQTQPYQPTGTPVVPTPASSPFDTSPAGPTPADAAKLAPAAPVSDLPTMTVAALPPEGVDTLRLIALGGPFPYRQDGATFANREGLLPPHPSGWYKEYTVVTPGSTDRGARRIVAGADGGRFYTSDHYASFREVLSGVSP
jgi:ribonuclease T1